MSAQSNIFQETVESIQRLLAPKGASIVQSALVVPQSGGAKREIDVLVTYVNELGLPIKIAVEAKDYARAVTVNTVESYIGKYNNNGGITVDKVVIVAARFSKTAQERAAAVGFTVCTLNELQSEVQGTFTKGEHEKGAWWAVNGNENGGDKVTATLFDIKGLKVPLNARITGEKTKTDMGAAYDWAERLLTYFVGPAADAIFAQFAGDMVHVVIDVFFGDHRATLGGKSEKLMRWEFDFGSRLRFPEMHPVQIEYCPEGGAPKTFGKEIGMGLNSDVVVLYEKPTDGPPQKIQIKVFDKSGKTAVHKTFRGRMDL